MDILTNTMVVPYALYEIMRSGVTIVADVNVPPDRIFLADGKGNIHYLSYEGKNLAGIKDDE